MLRAVLDANVFISAALRPSGTPGKLVQGFVAGTRPFELVTSPEIVDEVTRALAYPRVLRRIADDLDPVAWLLDVMSLADVVDDTGRSAGACPDPEDDRYIAAAIEGLAQFVVTGDRDVLEMRQHEGVRLVSPRAFLELLENRPR